jgi:hypothetical protein
MIKQSAQDACFYEPDWYCPEEIKLSSGSIVNHYREYPGLGYVDMHVPPYRIRSQGGNSKVGTIARYKSHRGIRTNNGRFHFKTVLSVPEIHPDTEQRLRDRIKLLLIMS